MYTLIYISTKSYIIVNLWYQNLKFDKAYLPKGYLVLVIPGEVSIDQVHYWNPQLYTEHGDYGVDAMKVEIEAVKVARLDFLRGILPTFEH